MAAPFQADVVRHDDVHIFSEFDDEERKGYVEMILANNPGLARIPRGSMFYLWFAEKDVLRQIAYQEGDWSSQLVRCRLTTTPTSAAGDAVGTIAQRRSLGKAERDSEQQEANLPKPENDDKARASNLVKKTLMRDGNQCVLTKHGGIGVEVAHIVPFKLHKSSRDQLWYLLQDFWGAKADAWKNSIVGADGGFHTERPENLITLNRLVHGYWDYCQCAFRPVRVAENGLSMDVSFYWLPMVSGKQSDEVRIDRNPYNPDARTVNCSTPGQNLKVYNYETDEVIKSGEIFTITTTDKKERPLPSKELLDLLWVLKRIAAMRGGGEDEENETQQRCR